MPLDARAVRVADVARRGVGCGGPDWERHDDDDGSDDNSIEGRVCVVVAVAGLEQRDRGRLSFFVVVSFPDARGDQDRPFCILSASLVGRGGRGWGSGPPRDGAVGADAEKEAVEEASTPIVVRRRRRRPLVEKRRRRLLVLRCRDVTYRCRRALCVRCHARLQVAAVVEGEEGGDGGVEERRGARSKRRRRRRRCGHCKQLEQHRLSFFLIPQPRQSLCNHVK